MEALKNKVQEIIRPFFFGAKLIASIKTDGALRLIAIGNTLRRVASKCAGSKVSDERKVDCGKILVGCGNRKGSKIADNLPKHT